LSVVHYEGAIILEVNNFGYIEIIITFNRELTSRISTKTSLAIPHHFTKCGGLSP